jgi:hypothetical protein
LLNQQYLQEKYAKIFSPFEEPPQFCPPDEDGNRIQCWGDALNADPDWRYKSRCRDVQEHCTEYEQIVILVNFKSGIKFFSKDSKFVRDPVFSKKAQKLPILATLRWRSISDETNKGYFFSFKYFKKIPLAEVKEQMRQAFCQNSTENPISRGAFFSPIFETGSRDRRFRGRDQSRLKPLLEVLKKNF